MDKTIIKWILCLLLGAIISLPLTMKAQDNEEEILYSFGNPYLRMAWFDRYPYAFLENPYTTDTVTGLDIELSKAFAKKAQEKLDFKNMDWNATLKALKNGEVDLASGATYQAENEEFVYYSIPYRFEENYFYTLQQNSLKFDFKNVDQLLEFISKNPFKLGMLKNDSNTDANLIHFISNPLYKDKIVYVNNEQEALNKLISKELQGFIGDRVVTTTLIWKQKEGNLFAEKEIDLKFPLYLIFSKKKVSNDLVLKFNEAIQSVQNSVEYKNIISWYLYPILLVQTVDTRWFDVINIAGTLCFAISGVILAYSIQASLLGAFIFALLPSIGGGILRDVIFNQRPVEALSSSIYLLIICYTVLIGFILTKILDALESRGSPHINEFLSKKMSNHYHLLFIICDSLGLAVFTVTGVMISFAAKVDPLWLWGPFFAFITAAAGPILRDLLSKSAKLEDIEGDVYSEIAFIWGFFLSIGLLYNTYNIRIEVINLLVLMTILGAFLTRVLIYLFRIPNVYFR